MLDEVCFPLHVVGEERPVIENIDYFVFLIDLPQAADLREVPAT
jgi:hypothetical protein